MTPNFSRIFFLLISSMVWTFLSKDRGNFHNLLDFSGRYIYRNDRESTAYNRICSKEADAIIRNYLAGLVFLSMGGASAEILPAYVFIDQGIKTTTTEVKFPFIDEKSDTEFILNLILQLTILIHGFFVYVGIEIMMMLIENVAIVIPKLTDHEFRQSIEKYEQNEISKHQLRLEFRNIVVQCLDYDR